MSKTFAEIRRIARYPLVQGMLSYAITWPACSVTQEYIDKETSIWEANWSKAARYSIFGAFFMCPVFYNWLQFSNRIFRTKTLVDCMRRAAIEQVVYSPFALAYFFFGMSLIEGNSIEMCIHEVREKFWHTYKLGALFWPTAQTVNFYLISEKNRIFFVGAMSFVWTIYLAHVKSISDAQLLKEAQLIEESLLEIEKQALEIEKQAREIEKQALEKVTSDKTE